jgi:hypothetical protein
LRSLTYRAHHCIQQGAHLSHLATGKVFAAALPVKVATLADPGTKALALVETVAAIAKRATVFFIVKIILYWTV